MSIMPSFFHQLCLPNPKMQRRLLAIFLCSVLAGCANQRHLPDRTEIPKSDNAERVGAKVLALIQKPSTERDAAQFIGSRASFTGGAAPPGANVDLMIAADVRLNVHIIPYRDVRPMATYWGASVVGIIQSIDLKTKTIVIQAKPDDFMVGDTQ